jgi:hypothetical protein
MCSALVLSRALSSRGEARSNLVCHPLERVLSAATRHVTLPDAPCLPAARLLTAWPGTPVPTVRALAARRRLEGEEGSSDGCSRDRRRNL